ncbi:helix-turn-helix domain-containing protein [Streptococcus mutans]|uniref:helix-turn-helix domain-containing protein n=1 Tax=Streptococcus mutans TaxID=1309 RepID=UPI0003101A10|nr:helix-turn-helix transcriptional regulator [Streptococcus mutans]
MTQLELAEKMRVTDKAVSKWERDLSFPNINSIPKLAEIFEVSVDDLMQVKTNTKETISKNK